MSFGLLSLSLTSFVLLSLAGPSLSKGLIIDLEIAAFAFLILAGLFYAAYDINKNGP